MDTTNPAPADEEPAPFRWSFSQWETYNKCPARWKYKSVLRLPSLPPGPAAARGIEMHNRVEAYIEGRSDSLERDPILRFGDKKAVAIDPKYYDVIEGYRDHDCNVRHCEYKLAFDNEWYLTAPTSRVRSLLMVLDAVKSKAGIVDIAEWKSGSPKDTHADQRKIYALGGLKAWLADEVKVTTYYLEDTAPPQRLVVKSSAYEKLRDLWQGRVEQMQQDQICAPRPNPECRWCDYSRGRGGPCQF